MRGTAGPSPARIVPPCPPLPPTRGEGDFKNGVGGWKQHALTAALRRPIDSVALLFSDIDATIGRDGIDAGFAKLLIRLVKDLRINGAENPPPEGPLIIVSNHPGAYDVLLLGATLGRCDPCIPTSTVPLYRAITNFRKHTIEVGTTPGGGIRPIRESVRHLLDGGSLLIFPSGLMDPDPEILYGPLVAPGAMEVRVVRIRVEQHSYRGAPSRSLDAGPQPGIGVGRYVAASGPSKSARS